MTKEQMAELLDGREYREEISSAEEVLAKDSGLVVVFGYSDDNVELRGSLNEELSAYEGTEIFVTKNRIVSGDHECDCEFCGYKEAMKNGKKIKAIWCDKTSGYTWTYQTEIPHATFSIKEGEEKFCRGIVFSTQDL